MNSIARVGSVRARVGVRDLRLASPTLESVFLHLTGRELRE